jgi:predicted nucleotidyltransferase
MDMAVAGMDGVKLADTLRILLRREIEVRGLPVKIVYLHGSFLKGIQRAGSDIDIAVLIDEGEYDRSPLESFMEINSLCARLEQELGRDIDLSILNKASLAFCYHAVVDGIPVYYSSKKALYHYQNKIVGMYFDFKDFVRDCSARYAGI